MCVPIKDNGDYLVVVREGKYAFVKTWDIQNEYWDEQIDDEFTRLADGIAGRFPFPVGDLDDHVCKQTHVVD